MATTNNMKFTQLEVGQKEKEVVINSNFAIVDGMLLTTTINTTNGTATALPLPAAAFVDDSTYDFDGVIVARHTTTSGQNKSFKVDFMCRREAGANTIALVQSATIATRFTGGPGWAVAVTVSTQSGAPVINVTGEAGATIQWVGNFRVTKVVG